MSTTKQSPAKKARGPVARITETWSSKSGKDVKVKDRVRMADGTVIDVIGRWTKRKDGKKIPCITGHIVSFAAGATLAEGGKGKQVGDRQNAVAAEVTHVSKK